MSLSRRVRATVLAASVPVAVLAGVTTQVVFASQADAVTITKVALKGTQLRVEGVSVPGASIVMIESTTSAVSARTDAKGGFKAASDTFTAPDCRLTINDFHSPAQTVTIPSCTPSVTAPGAPAPATGTCVITPQPNATTLTAGTQSVFWFFATGCNPNGPLSYSVVGGAIPTGMTVGTYQNSSSGNIIGTPSVPGTYRFTIQVTDAGGATDQENFTITVV